MINRRAGSLDSTARLTRSRNGISLASSAKTRAPPCGSGTRANAGGLSNPVSHGEISRTNQPDGARRNRMPMATALGGTAMIGPQARPIQRPARVPGNVARTARLAASASAVVARAVPSVRVMAVARPGVASASRIGCHDRPVPPNAGKYPAAGRTTPMKPATSGRTRSASSVASAT